jgi:glutathione S-transferase
MTIEVSAYRWVPPFAQGYVKDLRVRWALNEAGLPYEIVLIDHPVAESAGYRAWQPFGQVPAYRDETVELFESGAIVLHIAARSEALAPADPAGRARVTSWVFAALNSIEPFAMNMNEVNDAPAGATWPEERRPQVEAALNRRLSGLSVWLGDKPYLEGRFTAADLVMASVLRELVDGGHLAAYPNLDAYRQRCTARPAFERALEAQLATFRQHEPA